MEEFVQVCPICGSQNFNVDKSNTYLNAAGANKNFFCGNCKNIFSFPVELSEKDALNAAKKVKKFPSATPQTKIAPIGFFYIHVLLKIIGATLVVLGVSEFAVSSFLRGFFIIVAGVALLHFSFKRDSEFNQKSDFVEAKN